VRRPAGADTGLCSFGARAANGERILEAGTGPCGEKLPQLDGIERWCEVETLARPATEAPELRRLRLGLHALGDAGDIEGLGEIDDRLHQSRSREVGVETGDERPVDLERVNREIL
jgi:hypothetical protein